MDCDTSIPLSVKKINILVCLSVLSNEVNGKPVDSIIFPKNNDFSILGTKRVILRKKKLKYLDKSLQHLIKSASLKWH